MNGPRERSRAGLADFGVRAVLLLLDDAAAGGEDRWAVVFDGHEDTYPQVRLSMAQRQVPESVDLGRHIESCADAELNLSIKFECVLPPAKSWTARDVAVMARLRASPRREVFIAGNPVRFLTEEQLRGSSLSRECFAILQEGARRRRAERAALRLGSDLGDVASRSISFLERHVLTEDGRTGWTQYLDSRDQTPIGILSTAQGALSFIHAGDRRPLVDEAIDTLEALQNQDGGWQVRRALVGGPSTVSVTESTCYCLWALHAAGRASSRSARLGVAWLEDAQRDDGSWCPSHHTEESLVTTTAFAVRILVMYGSGAAAERGAAWLRRVQRPDGGWGPRPGPARSAQDASAAAYTAHAVLALAALHRTGHDAMRRGCEFLEQAFDQDGDEPWRSASLNTVIDTANGSRLDYRLFATPWCLLALSSCGLGLSDWMVVHGTSRLIDLQERSGGWNCELTASGTYPIWALHDALFALRTVLAPGSRELSMLALAKYKETEIAVLRRAVLTLLSKPDQQRARSSFRDVVQNAWLSALTLAVVIIIAGQLDLFRVFTTDSAPLRTLSTVVAVVLAVLSALGPPILAEEYKLRRSKKLEPRG